MTYLALIVKEWLYNFLIHIIVLGPEEIHSYIDCFNIFLFVSEQIMMIRKLHKIAVKIPVVFKLLLLSATKVSYVIESDISFLYDPFLSLKKSDGFR